MIKQSCLLLMISISALIASAEEIHINAKTGNDKNTGSQSQPLKTLGEAANRINANTTKEATTIILSEGVYALTAASGHSDLIIFSLVYHPEYLSRLHHQPASYHFPAPALKPIQILSNRYRQLLRIR